MEKEKVPLGEEINPLKRKGGCVHKVKIYYDQLPYTFDPIGKLGWRIGGIGARITNFTNTKDEQSYEFEATAEALPNLIDYMRSFGKQRSTMAKKVEIEFACQEEVIASDGKK